MFEIGRDLELNYSESNRLPPLPKKDKSVGRANASVCTHATCDDTDYL